MSNPPKQSSGGGKALRGRSKDSPEVRLSKTLSWILRHGAKSEGLYMRPDGYVRVSDLVRLDFGTTLKYFERDVKCEAGFTQVFFAAYPDRPCRPTAHGRE
jgi:hypothetical protein